MKGDGVMGEVGRPSCGAVVNVEEGEDDARRTWLGWGVGGGGGSSTGGAEGGRVARKEGMAGRTRSRVGGGGVFWCGEVAGVCGAGACEDGAGENGGCSVSRCGWEREGGVGGVSEQEGMVKVMEGKEEGGGKWGGCKGWGTRRGGVGGMDGLKEGVQ